MAKDASGKDIKAGDTVLISATVESITRDGEICHLVLRTEKKAEPYPQGHTINLQASQVTLFEKTKAEKAKA